MDVLRAAEQRLRIALSGWQSSEPDWTETFTALHAYLELLPFVMPNDLAQSVAVMVLQLDEFVEEDDVPGCEASVARLTAVLVAMSDDHALRGNVACAASQRFAQLGEHESALQVAQIADFYFRMDVDVSALDEDELAFHADSLSELAKRFSALSRHEDALTVIADAIDIYSRLAQLDPNAYEGNLAGSLSNLGFSLSYLGKGEEALVVTTKAVHIYRRLAEQNSVAYDAYFVQSLTNLRFLFSDLGRSDEAILVATEAVHIYRRLAERHSSAYEGSLAGSLNDLGNTLADVGRRYEALVATSEAVDIRRRLAAENPSVYYADLADSLNNLGNGLSDVGRRDEAFEAAAEAVDAYRRLAAWRPAFYDGLLAGSLNNLGNRLSDVGRWDEAIVVATEAVDVRRRLSAQNPAIYDSNLTMALSNLGVNFYRLGRRDEALEVCREAVDAYRRLAAQHPAADEEDLAQPLNTLGVVLSDLGRHDEALVATAEAVDIRRRLAAQSPAMHAADLAQSLNNLGNMLSSVGRYDDALVATTEAVDTYRRVVASSPDVYDARLAGSLDHLGNRLSDLGRHDDALVATTEAVDTYRRLTAQKAAAYEADLAKSLGSLGIKLLKLGRYDDALVAIAEAVNTYHHLVAQNSVAYEADLANSLNSLGAALSKVGRLSDATDATAEAVDIYRRLATQNSAAYEGALARSLNNLSSDLLNLGRHVEAFACRHEAIRLHDFDLSSGARAVWSMLNAPRTLWPASASDDLYEAIDRVQELATVGHLGVVSFKDRQSLLAATAWLVTDAAVFLANERRVPQRAIEWLDAMVGVAAQLTMAASDEEFSRLELEHPDLAGRLRVALMGAGNSSDGQQPRSMRSTGRPVEPMQGGGMWAADPASGIRHLVSETPHSLLEEIRRQQGFEAFMVKRTFDEIVRRLSSRPTAIVALGSQGSCVLGIDRKGAVTTASIGVDGNDLLAAIGNRIGIGLALRRFVVDHVMDPLFDVMRDEQSFTVTPVGLASLLPIQSVVAVDYPERSIEARPLLSYRDTATEVQANAGLVVHSHGNLGNGMNALPQALEEANEVADLLDAAPVISDAFVASNAARTSFVDHVLSRLPAAGMVHIACHGANTATGSALYLGAEELDNERLARSLEQLEAAPAFVALSSCNSGRTALESPEQVIGLPTTFLAYGANAVLATHWPVADGTARALMSRFYRNWANGAAAGQALRDAQRDIIRESFGDRRVRGTSIDTVFAYFLAGDTSLLWSKGTVDSREQDRVIDDTEQRRLLSEVRNRHR